jgi:mono/diheme cytochrome c family protein
MDDKKRKASMRRYLPVLIGVLGLVAATAGAAGPATPAQESAPLDPAKIERGIKVYAAERCSSCHAIGGVGNRRYPLDGVGSRLTREKIQTWIVAPQEMDPRVRKRAYKLNNEDLEGLVTYILSLREPKK